MNHKDAIQHIQDLAIKYKVNVKFDCPDTGHNHGACAGKDIFLGTFDNPEIMMAAFLHELGHIKTNVSMKRWLWRGSYILREFKAWDKAMDLAWKNKIALDDNIWAWGYTQALTYAFWYENERDLTLRITRNRMQVKLKSLAEFWSSQHFLKANIRGH